MTKIASRGGGPALILYVTEKPRSQSAVDMGRRAVTWHWLVFPLDEVYKNPDVDPRFLLAVTVLDGTADLQLRNGMGRGYSQV